MANQSMKLNRGYKCPIHGCDKKNRFYTIGGVVMHIISKHGQKELEKRLRVKYYKG